MVMGWGRPSFRGSQRPASAPASASASAPAPAPAPAPVPASAPAPSLASPFPHAITATTRTHPRHARTPPNVHCLAMRSWRLACLALFLLACGSGRSAGSQPSVDAGDDAEDPQDFAAITQSCAYSCPDVASCPESNDALRLPEHGRLVGHPPRRLVRRLGRRLPGGEAGPVHRDRGDRRGRQVRRHRSRRRRDRHPARRTPPRTRRPRLGLRRGRHGGRPHDVRRRPRDQRARRHGRRRPGRPRRTSRRSPPGLAAARRPSRATSSSPTPTRSTRPPPSSLRARSTSPRTTASCRRWRSTPRRAR